MQHLGKQAGPQLACQAVLLLAPLLEVLADLGVVVADQAGLEVVAARQREQVRLARSRANQLLLLAWSLDPAPASICSARCLDET